MDEVILRYIRVILRYIRVIQICSSYTEEYRGINLYGGIAELHWYSTVILRYSNNEVYYS